MKRLSRADAVALAVLAVAVFLRCQDLSLRPFHHDEGVNVVIVAARRNGCGARTNDATSTSAFTSSRSRRARHTASGPPKDSPSTIVGPLGRGSASSSAS